MPQAGAVRAGGAYVEITADDATLRAGLLRAQAQLRQFASAVKQVGASLTAFGAAVISPIILTAKTFANMGAEMALNAQKAGVTVEAMSALTYAAEQTQVPVDQLKVALFRMGRSLYEAQQGLKEPNEALATLGLKISDVISLDPEKRFALIADRISKLSDPSARAGAAVAIFGRGVVDLVPLLDKGAAGITEMTDRARSLGLIMKDSDAQAALTLTQKMDDLWQSIKFLGFAVGSSLAPVLTQLAKDLVKVVGAVRQFVDSHRGAIAVALSAGAAIAGLSIAAGVGLLALGYVLQTVAAGLAIVTAGIPLLIGAFGILVSVAPYVLGAIATMSLAAGAALHIFQNLAIEAIVSVVRGFQAMKDDAVASFHAIGNALLAGDWQLALKILGATIHLEFMRPISSIEEAFDEFRAWMFNLFNDIGYGLAERMAITLSSLKSLWINWSSWLQNQETDLTTAIKVMYGLVAGATPEDTFKTVQGGEIEKAARNQNAFNALSENAEKLRRDLASLATANQTVDTARRKQAQDAIAADEAQIQALRQQLALLQDTAKAEGNLSDSAKSLSSLFSAGEDQAAEGKHTFESIGTFNKAFAGQLGPKGSKHAEETARNTRQLATDVGVIKTKVGAGTFK